METVIINKELTYFVFTSKMNDMSNTYNPKKRKRKRAHGFMKRIKTKGGQKVLSERRKKGRKKLIP